MQIEMSDIKELKVFAVTVASMRGKRIGELQVADVEKQLDKEIAKLKRMKAVIGHTISSNDAITPSMYVPPFVGCMLKVAQGDIGKFSDEELHSS